MARVASAEAGERAFDVLCRYLGGLNRRMWCFHAGLTPSQLSSGLDWLRELFGESKAIVKVRRGGEWVYSLALDDRDVREHAERHMRTMQTRARRELNWWHDIAETNPTTENTRQAELARRRLVDLSYAYDAMFAERVDA